MFMPGIFVEYQEPPKDAEEKEEIQHEGGDPNSGAPVIKSLKHKELLKQFSRISVLDGSNYHIQDPKSTETDGTIRYCSRVLYLSIDRDSIKRTFTKS